MKRIVASVKLFEITIQHITPLNLQIVIEIKDQNKWNLPKYTAALRSIQFKRNDSSFKSSVSDMASSIHIRNLKNN